MTTDFRALCAELTDELSGYKMANPMHDYFLLNRARAALAAEVEPSADEGAAVAVAEWLPEPNVKVLAHYFNDLGNGRTICAIWVPAKTRSDSDGEDDFTEYDEETDKFYWPEGWYEQIENWEDLGWVRVYEGEVVCWQPLPKWPAHAISLSQHKDSQP